MFRVLVPFAALAFVACLAPANASVVITVDKSSQRLSVAVDGAQTYEWPVSTARWGYRTPNGTYHPQRLARKWFSHKYHMSPMPYSIFFNGGYAIHGSYEVSRLGRPASHGCIRLLPAHAAVLFKLVRANRGDTRIVVTGSRPAGRAIARRKASRRHVAHWGQQRQQYGHAYEDRFYGPREHFWSDNVTGDARRGSPWWMH